MAVTVSRVFEGRSGRQRMTVTNVTMDNSYASGGEALTANDLGLATVESVPHVVGYDATNTKAFLGRYDVANAKIMAFYFDYDAVADGGAIQVAASTDLSGVTFAVTAYGR